MHIQRNNKSSGAIPAQPNEMTYCTVAGRGKYRTKSVSKQTKPPKYNVNNYPPFRVVDK